MNLAVNLISAITFYGRHSSVKSVHMTFIEAWVLAVKEVEFFGQESTNVFPSPHWLDSDLIPRLLEIFEKIKNFYGHCIKRQK